jgi:predicted glycosyltransferase
MLQRFFIVLNNIENFDLSISCGSESAIWSSKLKNKRSIAFGDNDTARQWTYSKFVDFCFFPGAIDKDILIRQGIKQSKLYQYNGYKEDIYIANYTPDDKFLATIPFQNYVLVRPENIYANYIRKNNVTSIVPELLLKLIKRGINVIYLPKYEIDYTYIGKHDNLYIPVGPINGLDACYFADVVLTGAGTFAREAACLGTPSVSFYAGKDLLAVDKDLIKKNKIFYSRNVNDIINYSIKSEKDNSGTQRSKNVYNEVSEKLKDIIKSFGL